MKALNGDRNVIDPGYTETERILADLESELQALYEKAAEETQATATEYMANFVKATEEMLKKVDDGDITLDDYKRWRLTHFLTSQRFQLMADVMAADLLNVKKIAASIINGYIPDVYAINMNYETYSIESKTGISTSFTLYNRQAVERLIREHPDLLPFTQVDEKKVIRWDKQHINSAVAQGIMQGDSIPELAARMRMVTDMDERASIRSARTAITSAQNGGRMDAMRRVQDMGATVRKQWIATLDYRTRSAHRHLDGKVAKLDEAFASDLGDIRYPGDPKAKPGNVYNCRCCLVNYDPMFPFNASDISQRYSKRLEGMSYEEWKNAQPEYGKSNSSNRGYAINPDNPSYGYSGRNGLTSLRNNGIMQEKEFGVQYGNTDADMEYINSSEYASKFKGITGNEAVDNSLLECARASIEHRTGTLKEDMYFIHAESGEILASQTKMKTESGVSYNDEIEALLAKSKNENIPLITLHNHPEGYPPSVYDINKSFDNGTLFGLAVGHNGQVYKYSNPGERIECADEIHNIIFILCRDGSDPDRIFKEEYDRYGISYEILRGELL